MKGQIVKWDDSKGYGFISALDCEHRVFFHVSSVESINRRPKLNDHVTFDLSKDNQGRINAKNVYIEGVHGVPITILFSSIFLVVLAASIFAFDGEMFLLPLYLVASLFTYLMFAWDKQAALSGNWRTSENTLHLLSLIGGWPGALWAQYLLRHKSRKQPFKSILWVTIVFNICVLIGLFTTSGREFIQTSLASL